ncbi:type II toxin-antitoxin system VapC family toxin [Arcobacter vandammei]|uniref:type II toxin-antitoxin system VapC family toxin n=1 Tax=Arcobacter vandammei TaxID=2782243 RepID=UPI001D184F67|nr:type II toxin-antitoxin system VapC family toxin [Arcobacter vandammei]
MILLDSNTIIYLSKKLINIDDILEDETTPLVSVISYMEVLGYAFEDNKQRDFIKKLFSFLEIVYIDENIAKNTIKLREENRIKLPDAIICATALQRKAKLITNDEKLEIIYDKYNLG